MAPLTSADNRLAQCMECQRWRRIPGRKTLAQFLADEFPCLKGDRPAGLLCRYLDLEEGCSTPEDWMVRGPGHLFRTSA